MHQASLGFDPRSPLAAASAGARCGGAGGAGGDHSDADGDGGASEGGGASWGPGWGAPSGKLRLVGGLEHFVFFHLLGIIIPID